MTFYVFMVHLLVVLGLFYMVLPFLLVVIFFGYMWSTRIIENWETKIDSL